MFICFFFGQKRRVPPSSRRMFSSWIAEVIRAVYICMGPEDPVSIRSNPHSLRGVATSFADLGAVSPAEICRAAIRSKYLHV